jgi:hypothetical protein
MADVREYGVADGLQSTGGGERNNSVVADSSGKIWFSMTRGSPLLIRLTLQTNHQRFPRRSAFRLTTTP